jgi:glycosyltransferase involved in cell wall biosynthesis
VKFFSATTGFTHEVYFARDRFDRRAVLAAADVAAFLHVHDCGLTGAAQALTAGVAVLASTTPDLMELLDEQTALRVAPTPQRESAAAIVRLIEDPGLIDRLAARADRAGQAHRPARVRPRLEEIYESL